MANLWKAKVERQLWKLAHRDQIRQYARIYRKRNGYRLKEGSRVRMARTRARRRALLLWFVIKRLPKVELEKFLDPPPVPESGALRSANSPTQADSRCADFPTATPNGAIETHHRKRYKKHRKTASFSIGFKAL